jgi:hypothetical protein
MGTKEIAEAQFTQVLLSLQRKIGQAIDTVRQDTNENALINLVLDYVAVERLTNSDWVNKAI